jgi:hypothetical protein
MATFILFIFAAIGLTHILVDSNIFEPVRKWFKEQGPTQSEGVVEKVERFSCKWFCGKITEILSCYQCSGVWAGWFMGLLILTKWYDGGLLYNAWLNFTIVFSAGFASSFLANLGALIFTYLEAKAIIE